MKATQVPIINWSAQPDCSYCSGSGWVTNWYAFERHGKKRILLLTDSVAMRQGSEQGVSAATVAQEAAQQRGYGDMLVSTQAAPCECRRAG